MAMPSLRRIGVLRAFTVFTIVSYPVFVRGASGPDQLLNADLSIDERLSARFAAAAAPERRAPGSSRRMGSMSPAERREAIDAYWGEGPSTAEKLRIFDKF